MNEESPSGSIKLVIVQYSMHVVINKMKEMILRIWIDIE